MNINNLIGGGYRRRLMMACGNMKPLYPDDYVDDGWIWAYYEVTDTENPTTLLYDATAVNSMGANFIIDGVEVPRAQTYTFATTGEHLVKMQTTGLIVRSAFRAVNALKRIYMPSVVTGLATNNNNGVFYQNKGIEYVYLSPETTYIGRYAFYQCSNLKMLNLDLASITDLQPSSIRECTSLNKKVNLPGLATIGDTVFNKSAITEIVSLGAITTLVTNNNYGVFAGCTHLKKATLPISLINIGRAAFDGCSLLTRVVFNNAQTVTTIGVYAFRNSPITGSLNFPNLESLQDQSFRNTKITSIENLGKITSVDGASDGNGGAFRLCSELTTVTLPPTLTNIGRRAFYQCPKLETLTCLATVPPTFGAQCIPDNVQHIYVPAESVEDYKAASGWSSYASKIEAIPTT